jgi:hypothetical protein
MAGRTLCVQWRGPAPGYSIVGQLLDPVLDDEVFALILLSTVVALSLGVGQLTEKVSRVKVVVARVLRTESNWRKAAESADC